MGKWLQNPKGTVYSIYYKDVYVIYHIQGWTSRYKLDLPHMLQFTFYITARMIKGFAFINAICYSDGMETA
jgi:hypothetical protein